METPEIVFIYDNPEHRQTLESFENDKDVYLTFLDYGSKLSKKQAWALMEDWGARKLPFALVKVGESVTRCFYTEDGDRVLNDVKKYMSDAHISHS